jgi:hypothetical protein
VAEASAKLQPVCSIVRRTSAWGFENAVKPCFGGQVLSPDGRTAFVSNHGDGTISVIGHGRRRVTVKFAAGPGLQGARDRCGGETAPHGIFSDP